MTDSGYILVLTNMIIWVLALFFYQKRKRVYDAGSFVLTLYLFYSVCSFMFFNSPDSAGLYRDITIFPNIYFFFLFFIAFLPIRNYDYRKAQTISLPSGKIINLVAYLIILLSLISFPASIDRIGTGLTMIMLESEGGKELYEATADTISSTGSGSLSNITAVLFSAFSCIGVFLFFYYLTQDWKKNKIIVIGLGVSMVLGLFSAIASGSRNGPVNNLLGIVATFFLFKGFYNDKIKRVVKYVGIIVVALVIVPVLAITASRFGEDNSSSSILEYAGQANLNFNKYALDDNGIRYGDRTVPLFKRMVGFSNVPKNYIERRAKYPHLKINDESFVTFIGDIAIDYGPILCAIIIIGFSIIFIHKTKQNNKRMSFGKLLLLHFILYIFVQGGTLFPFADAGGNLRIVAYLLVYFASYLAISDRKPIRQEQITYS